MNRQQHTTVGIGMGVGSSLVAFAATRDVFSLVSFAGDIFGCTLPDWDHHGTKEGRVVRKTIKMTENVLTTVAVTFSVLAFFLIIKAPDIIAQYNINIEQAGLYACACIIFLLMKKVLSSNKFVRWAAKHRGIMHTLIVPILLIVGIYFLKVPVIGYFLYGTTTGYCSHLTADCFTREGCPLLFPLTTKNIRVPGFAYKSDDKRLYTVARFLAVGFAALGVVISKLMFNTGFLI